MRVLNACIGLSCVMLAFNLIVLKTDSGQLPKWVVVVDFMVFIGTMVAMIIAYHGVMSRKNQRD